MLKLLVTLDILSQALDAQDVTEQYLFCFLWNLGGQHKKLVQFSSHTVVTLLSCSHSAASIYLLESFAYTSMQTVIDKSTQNETSAKDQVGSIIYPPWSKDGEKSSEKPKQEPRR